MRKNLLWLAPIVLIPYLAWSASNRVIEATAIRNSGSTVSIPSSTNITANEVSYLSGVTSGIQTQINAKQTTGSYISSITGDVSATGPGAIVGTINSGVVSNSKLSTVSTSTFKGRTTAGTGAPEDLTTTQATALLNVFGPDSGAGGVKGLAPATVSGDSSKFLKGDGTWSSPSGSGDVSGPAGVTADQMAIYSGATGKILKAFSSTGIVTNTLGVYGTTAKPTGTVLGTSDTQVVTNKNIDADLNSISNIDNNEIKAAAAIAVNKLAALTASQAAVIDGSGFIAAHGSTTSVQIGYLSDLTGNIQAQLGNKLNLSGGTLTGDLTLNADPGSALKAATKQYVDNSITATDYKNASKYATTNALPTNVYANGSSGVGATLTGVSFGALVIDGNTPSIGDRVLIKSEVTQANNGIYTVTTVGSGIAVYVLTRATDFDTAAEISSGDATFITNGSDLSNSTWSLNEVGAVTVGTTALPWVQTAGSLGAGTGITINGTTVSISTPVTVANGGTGQTTYTDGQLLIGNTSGNTLSKAALTQGSGVTITNGNGTITIAATGGTGDVTGSSGVTQDQLAVYNGSTGKIIKAFSSTGIVTNVLGVYGTTAKPTGTVVGTSDTQVITNKNIDGSLNPITNISNAEHATMATATFKGRTTAGTGFPEDLSVTQATAMLNVFGADAGAGGVKGLAPATVAGDSARFLRGDGTWTSPSGSGDVVGPSSVTADQMAIYNGTTGKLIKAFSSTGIVTNVLGVYGTTAKPSGAVVGTTDTQSLTNKTLDNTNTITVKDASSFTIQNTSDTTKQIRIDASGLSSGTTRTKTINDRTTYLADQADVQTYGSGTFQWNMPNQATMVSVQCVGGGGGGGGGQSAIAANSETGGAGGGGGSYVTRLMMANSVTTPVTMTIGGGGAGGPGGGTTAAIGRDGIQGLNSQFGTYVIAYGGGGGAGGGGAAARSGGSGAGILAAGNSANSATTSLNGGNPNAATGSSIGTEGGGAGTSGSNVVGHPGFDGGGSGGGTTAGAAGKNGGTSVRGGGGGGGGAGGGNGTQFGGGDGGGSPAYITQAAGGGGGDAGGAAGGSPGGSGAGNHVYGGNGGGGGGSSNSSSTNGGLGGQGGQYGGGGGGGGAGTSGGTASGGNGGNGDNGICIVTTFF